MNRKDFFKSLIAGAAVAPAVVEAAGRVKEVPLSHLSPKTVSMSVPVSKHMIRGRILTFNEVYPDGDIFAPGAMITGTHLKAARFNHDPTKAIGKLLDASVMPDGSLGFTYEKIKG